MKHILIFSGVIIGSIVIAFIIMLIIEKLIKRTIKPSIKSLAITVISLISIFIAGIIYVLQYEHADESVNKYLNSSDTLKVEQIDEGYFFDSKKSDKAIIFYPGAKVEFIAYAPLMYKLAEEGYDCFLIKMPLNIAILGKSKAEKIINTYKYDNYYMMGHSLGGLEAASFASGNDNIDGMIFLASYSTVKLDNMKVLSLYGSNDGVLNKKEYESNKKNLPSNYNEVIIPGGNHTQFGNYNLQDGDNVATISYDYQQEEVVKNIKEYM